MTTADTHAPTAQTPRLVASWMIVGIPLVYGLFQTVKTVTPLFGG